MSDELIDAALLEPAGGPVERPRFRLQQLFVLMAVMAVMLAVSGPPQSFPEEPESEAYQHLMTAWTVVTAILNSVALTVTGYGLVWRRRGGAFLVQPGHWLLLVMSIAALVGVIQTIGFRVLTRFTDFDVPTTPTGAPTMPSNVQIALIIGMFGFSMAVVAIHLIVNILVGRKQTEQRWKWVFYLKAMGVFLWFLGSIFVLGWLVRSVQLDRREQIRHDSFHWCGVALELCLDVLMLAWSAGTVVFLSAQFM